MLSILTPTPPVDPMQRAMMVAKDSSVAPAAASVFGGFVMGFGFSLFGSMISAETATQSMGTADFFRYSLRNAVRLGSGFAFFGFLFSGLDIALEKRRGRKDVWNPTCSGGLIASVYGWRSYKWPGLWGGLVGGAVLSLIFERLIDSLGFGQK